MLPAWMARVLKPNSRSAMRITLPFGAAASVSHSNARQSGADHLIGRHDACEAAAVEVHRGCAGELRGTESDASRSVEVERVRRVEWNGDLVAEITSDARG